MTRRAAALAPALVLLLVLGTGTARAATAVTFTTGGASPLTRVSALADVDGDGLLDAGGTSLARPAYARGIGGGGYENPVLLPTAFDPDTVVDLEDDGDLDSVSISRTTLTVVLGDGHGGFATRSRPLPTTSGLSVYEAHAGVADLTGDGRPDLLVRRDSGADQELMVMAGVGQAYFAQPQRVGGSSSGDLRAYALADLDGDGDTDLLYQAGRSAVELATLSAVLSTGGVSTATSVVAVHARPSISGLATFAVGDVTGDGHPDVLTLDDGATVTAHLGGPGLDVSSAAPPVAVSAGAAQLATADLDADGLPDLLVDGVRTVASGAYEHALDVLVSDGSGGALSTSTTRATDSSSAPTRPVAVDLSGDGRRDVAWGPRYLRQDGRARPGTTPPACAPATTRMDGPTLYAATGVRDLASGLLTVRGIVTYNAYVRWSLVPGTQDTVQVVTTRVDPAKRWSSAYDVVDLAGRSARCTASSG